MLDVGCLSNPKIHPILHMFYIMRKFQFARNKIITKVIYLIKTVVQGIQ